MTADSSALSDPSPCIHKCKIGQTGMCRGCGRTLEEICQWKDMSYDQKLQIAVSCRTRKFDRRSNR